MADPDKGTDADKLLAEVDHMLSGPSGARPAKREPEQDQRSGGLRARVRAAAVTGAVGAGFVWLLFAFLPFLGATSGAAGAFLAGFVAVLVLRRRR